MSWLAPFLWALVEGKLVITQVSELCTCDLAPGDIVTAIDRIPVRQALAGEAALMSSATPQWSDVRVLRRLRSGPERGARALTVERGGVAHDVRVALLAPSAAPIEKRPSSGELVAPGIRYLNLAKATDEEWNRILPDLAAADAVICDLRGYPNLSIRTPLAHFTKQPLRSAQWHIPLPGRPDREGMTFAKQGWSLMPAEPFVRNVVFLTDGNAISAAETFMGIVEAYKLGPIVGGATAGTNGNINPFHLPGGYLVWWTGLKVLKQDGSRHYGVGISPTVPVARTLSGITAQRDEVLEKGIEVARQLSQSTRHEPPRKLPARN